MKQTLELIARLIADQSNFKDRIQVLADSAGIDTRSRDGIVHDIISVCKKPEKMCCVEFIIAMLTLMVRSYTGHDDTRLVPVIDDLYNLHFERMNVAERLFYQLLKLRFSEMQSETPPWDEESVPVQANLIGDFTAR